MPTEWRGPLSVAGWTVVEVCRRLRGKSDECSNFANDQGERWGHMATKLCLWQLTQYERVLDAGTIMTGPVDEPSFPPSRCSACSRPSRAARGLAAPTARPPLARPRSRRTARRSEPRGDRRRRARVARAGGGADADDAARTPALLPHTIHQWGRAESQRPQLSHRLASSAHSAADGADGTAPDARRLELLGLALLLLLLLRGGGGLGGGESRRAHLAAAVLLLLPLPGSPNPALLSSHPTEHSSLINAADQCCRESPP